MKSNLYSVFDEKANTYNAPFPLSTDGLAIRSFLQACKDPQTDLAKYPGDYKLYCVGSFDFESGEFTSVIPPRYLAVNEVKE